MALTAPQPLIAPLPDIRAILGDHYRRLGTLSRRLRFLSPAGDAFLDRVAKTARPMIVIKLEDDGSVCGIAEIHEIRPGEVEIGLSLEDAYQGRGHGTGLFQAALEAARGRGYHRAHLYFSSENIAMTHLARSHAATCRRSDGEVLAVIAL